MTNDIMQSVIESKSRRAGISLLEVLISVGVVAIGIFGVVSLIPVAQLSVEKGLTADRQASFGRSAVADFRIRNMGFPGFVDPQNPDASKPNWVSVPMIERGVSAGTLATVFDNETGQLIRRGYCLDPLGIADVFATLGADAGMRFFPGRATTVAGYLLMPRISLRSIYAQPGLSDGQRSALARQIFFLKDDLVFNRPNSEDLPPNRQFFVSADGAPVREYAEGGFSWFATITPTIANVSVPTDQFILSVVIVRNRIPNPNTEEGLAQVASQYAGEVILEDGTPANSGQMGVADLKVGDWLLLAKQLKKTTPENRAVYRWTKILGADGNEGRGGVSRTFTIANDDFYKPSTAVAAEGGGVVVGHAIFMRGVEAVYERAIHLEESSLW